jgi:hypothetical protein
MPASLRSLGLSPFVSRPLKRIVPAPGVRNPKTVRSSVDLPAPLGPITSVIALARAATLSPRRMSTPGV